MFSLYDSYLCQKLESQRATQGMAVDNAFKGGQQSEIEKAIGDQEKSLAEAEAKLNLARGELGTNRTVWEWATGQDNQSVAPEVKALEDEVEQLKLVIASRKRVLAQRLEKGTIQTPEVLEVNETVEAAARGGLSIAKAFLSSLDAGLKANRPILDHIAQLKAKMEDPAQASETRSINETYDKRIQENRVANIPSDQKQQNERQLEESRRKELEDSKSKYSQQQDTALINLEYDRKVRDNSEKKPEDQVSPKLLEEARQQELAAIKEKYAQQDVARAQQYANQISAQQFADAQRDADKKRGIDEANAKDLKRMEIESTMSGTAKDQALLQLRQDEERKKALADGANMDLVDQKQSIERMMAGKQNDKEAIVGTFDGMALAGMGTGDGVLDPVEENTKQALEKFDRLIAAVEANNADELG